MKIYLASSWRNPGHPAMVGYLRFLGYEVYDFRNPFYGNYGFHWSDIDKNWQQWSVEEYVEALEHDIASQGFKRDFDAMEWAEACVCQLPCGRSAHLEAGWFAGQDLPLIMYVPAGESVEPELMYKMADAVVSTPRDLADALQEADRTMLDRNA